MSSRTARFRAVERRIFDRFLPDAVEHRVGWKGGLLRVVEAGAGPPVVFLHGITGTLTNFASLAGDLVSTNRCVLVDMPGHGLSGSLDVDDAPPREVLVDAVAAVLDERVGDGAATLVGNSLGGMVALYLAADRPQRVGAIGVLGEPAYAFVGARARFPLNLIGLPIIGPVLLRMPPPPRRVYARAVRGAFGAGALETIDTDVLDANRMAVWVGRNASSVAGLMGSLMDRNGMAAAGVPLSDNDLASIRIPIWFLWGDRDPFMSAEMGKPWVERLPNATIDVIEGGHLPWLDAHDLTLRRLQECLT